LSRFGQLHDAYAEKPDWRDATDDPRWIAHIEEGVSSWTAEQDAAVASIDTDDLTPAGALALLDYAGSIEENFSDPWPEVLDDNQKPCSWHSLMMKKVTEALQPAMARAPLAWPWPAGSRWRATRFFKG
jgi:hypothetical protein